VRVAALQALRNGLEEIPAGTLQADIVDYRQWIDRVARFSFGHA